MKLRSTTVVLGGALLLMWTGSAAFADNAASNDNGTPTDSAPRKADAKAKEIDGGILGALSAAHIHLGKTYQDAISGKLDAADPATISFLTTAGKGTVFSSDFGVAWTPPAHRSGLWEHKPIVSIEGSVASVDSGNADAIRTRISDRIERPAHLLIFDNAEIQLSLKHEADQRFRTQRLTGELVFIPIKKRWGVGEERPIGVSDVLDPKAKVWYRIEPEFGVDGGTTLVNADSKEADGSVLRASVHLKAYLRFKRLLGASSAKLFADNTTHFLVLQDGRNAFNYLDLGLELPFSKTVSFVLDYKVGEASPTYRKTETFGGSVGLKF